MKKNLLLALRLLLWLVPVTLLVSAIIADSFFDQKEELARAKGSLVEGDLDKAAGVYSRLRESLWWSDEALTAVLGSEQLAEWLQGGRII